MGDGGGAVADCRELGVVGGELGVGTFLAGGLVVGLLLGVVGGGDALDAVLGVGAAGVADLGGGAALVVLEAGRL